MEGIDRDRQMIERNKQLLLETRQTTSSFLIPNVFEESYQSCWHTRYIVLWRNLPVSLKQYMLSREGIRIRRGRWKEKRLYVLLPSLKRYPRSSERVPIQLIALLKRSTTLGVAKEFPVIHNMIYIWLLILLIYIPFSFSFLTKNTDRVYLYFWEDLGRLVFGTNGFASRS